MRRRRRKRRRRRRKRRRREQYLCFVYGFSPFFSIMKGGTQGFPRHEVSDKQEVLFEDVSPSTAFSIRKCRRRRNVFEQNFLFVAHFVSGKPLCPALHNIKMRVSSKKSFTLLKSFFFCVHIDDFPSAWPSYPLLMIHFALYYLFLCFFLVVRFLFRLI